MLNMSEVYLNPVLLGGLGNQLFIISAAFKIAEERNMKILILRGTKPGDRLKEWDQFFNDCPRILSSLVETLPQITWDNFTRKETSSEFFEINFREGVSTIVECFFQNIKYLPSQCYVRKLFNVREKQDKLQQTLTNINFKTTCAIHFRLGDYKWISHHFLILPDSYYKSALNSLFQRNSEIDTLLVVNEHEDQHLVQERMKTIVVGFRCDVKFITGYRLRDWEEMIAMSMCSSIIIANSTFSWWSAYFADQKTTVVYPAYWHHGQGEFPEHALALPGWIKH